MSTAKDHDKLEEAVDEWRVHWEPTPPHYPTRTPGMFQSYSAAFWAIFKVFAAMVVATLLFTGFVVAIIRQPAAAVVAGSGCLGFAWGFYFLGQREGGRGWQIAGVSLAVLLIVLAAVVWGVL